MMRAATGSETPREFLQTLFDGVSPDKELIANALDPSDLSVIRAISIENKYPLVMGVNPCKPLSNVYQIYDIYCHIERRNADDALRSIIGAYNYDSGTCAWLNWRTINDMFRTADLPVSAETAFLRFMMGQPYVSARFPEVQVELGRGAFVGELHDLLKAMPPERARSPVVPSKEARCLAAIASLKGNASKAMTAAVLRREILDRLSYSFGRISKWPDSNQQGQNVTRRLPHSEDEIRLSMLRIDMAAEAFLIGLIKDVERDEIKQAELQIIGISRLREQQRSGKLRPNKAAIADHLLAIFESPLDLMLTAHQADRNKASKNHFLPLTFVQALAKDIAHTLVERGPQSFKLLISETLTHGQLTTRFVRAFEEAVVVGISAIQGRPQETEKSIDWTPSQLFFRVGSLSVAEQLIAARDELNKQIAEYNSREPLNSMTDEPGH